LLWLRGKSEVCSGPIFELELGVVSGGYFLFFDGEVFDRRVSGENKAWFFLPLGSCFGVNLDEGE
jgi:hypothetical protein